MGLDFGLRRNDGKKLRKNTIRGIFIFRCDQEVMVVRRGNERVDVIPLSQRNCLKYMTKFMNSGTQSHGDRYLRLLPEFIIHTDKTRVISASDMSRVERRVYDKKREIHRGPGR